LLKQILSPIQIYLDQTQNILIKTYNIKAGKLDSLVHLKFSPAELTLRPALIILSSAIFGPVTQLIINLAAMFQFVHIASSLHKDVSENDGSQFPILIGDYFYSKSFLILYETGLFKYLRMLSELIGQFNEASILKLKNPGDLEVVEDYVKKDTASFFAWGCRMGAEINGADEQKVKNLYYFGFNLGMATGLRKENIYPEKAVLYFYEAKKQLGSLPAETARDTLEKLVDYQSGIL
jgi:hypothetical protein